ncbi:MAG: ABC transporter substrate binding protein [Polyangia bacterium]
MTKHLVSMLAALSLSAAAHATPTEVVLVKRPGVMAYEEVAEAFREGCRVQARMVNLDHVSPPWRFGPSQLVITVGQEAFDAVQAAPDHVIATLAFNVHEGVLGPPAAAAPELTLHALVTARPSVKVIGVVYGPRTAAAFARAKEEAHRMGLELRGTEATNGPQAVRALRELVDSVQALWLPFDIDVVTPQLFQYALRLQIERGLPIAAATRQQVHSGALIAVDFSARATGRAAADIANALLDGRSPQALSSDRLDLLSGARITVNGDVARRLGADLPALLRMGARVE